MIIRPYNSLLFAPTIPYHLPLQRPIIFPVVIIAPRKHPKAFTIPRAPPHRERMSPEARRLHPPKSGQTKKIALSRSFLDSIDVLAFWLPSHRRSADQVGEGASDAVVLVVRRGG